MPNPFPTPGTGTFPQFIPYSPSTFYTMDALDRVGVLRQPITIALACNPNSRAAPSWTSRTPEHATCTKSWAVTINQASGLCGNPIRGQTTNTVANVGLRAPYLGWATDSMYYFRTDKRLGTAHCKQRSRRNSNIAFSTRVPTPGRDC